MLPLLSLLPPVPSMPAAYSPRSPNVLLSTVKIGKLFLSRSLGERQMRIYQSHRGSVVPTEDNGGDRRSTWVQSHLPLA